MNNSNLSRRDFVRRGLTVAAGAPLAWRFAEASLSGAPADGPRRTDAKTAIVACRGYGPEFRTALDKSFDLLGGIGPLVKDKTVTVKINLTGTDFSPYLGRSVGETYLTHPDTALALGSALIAAGARRVRFVESTNSKAALSSTLSLGGWDMKAFESLGRVEFENTRNLGVGKNYAHLPVPNGGRVFSAFDFNHAYADTDVLVSLAKLKQHVTAGVTLSMKNLFGITPNSLYGSAAGSEEATEGRGVLHDPHSAPKVKPPGLKDGLPIEAATVRVPQIVADICAARPIHLSVIDGVTSVSGGEGPWCANVATLKAVSPGVLIVGLNPVSTDAVATAVMGYPDPRSTTAKPFNFCANHLLLAEQSGIGAADLARIEVRGLSVAQAKYPYG